jgi:hypothetical protein
MFRMHLILNLTLVRAPALASLLPKPIQISPILSNLTLCDIGKLDTLHKRRSSRTTPRANHHHTVTSPSRLVPGGLGTQRESSSPSLAGREVGTLRIPNHTPGFKYAEA